MLSGSPRLPYFAFMFQRPRKTHNRLGSGPMVHIANECTPFFSGRRDGVFQL